MRFKLFIILSFVSFQSFSQKNLDTKLYGQKILAGTFKPADDEITFQVLDSLFCKNPVNKDFYFKVANKIQNLSDGALGEYFSGIASKYYLEYTREFIQQSSKLTPNEIDGWLNQVCYDIAATEQHAKNLPQIKKQLDLLVLNCKCSDSQKALIKKYNTNIYSCVEESLKNP